MVNWRADICPNDMCILLYVKLIWCSGITDIYGELEVGALVYVHSAICETFLGVAVFYTSVVNWRGYICPQYMCIVLYVRCIWCSGIPYIYGQLEWGDICPKDMCILLYVKLIWCSGLPWIYGRLEGVVLPADLPSLV